MPTHRNNFVISVLFTVVLVFSILGVLRAATPSSIAPDSWFHITIGRYIIDHKHIPSHADISIKTAEPALEWISSNWIADSIMYLATGASVHFGSVILISLLLLLSLYLANDIGILLGFSYPARMSALCIGSIGILAAWKLHPLMFLPIVILSMMEAYIRWKHTNNRLYLVLLPIILWIGANVVGGFLFIPAIVLVCMGAVDLGTVIVTSQTINHRLQLLRTWFFVLVGSMAATLFTPSGMRLPIYSTTMVALLLSKKWYSTLGGALEAANSSIIKSAPSGIVFIIPLLFIIWLLAVLSYMTLSHTSSFTKRNIILIPLVPLLFFPFLWVRFIPLAILCSLPLVMLSIDSIRGNLRQFFLPILMGISTLLALGMWFRPPTLLSIQPPKEQFDLINTLDIPKRLLTSTDITGYALYREYPTRQLVDAQEDLFDEHDTIAIYSQYSQADGKEIQSLIDAYHISAILVSKDNDYLTGALSANPDWALIYLDYNGILFVKRDLVDPTLLSTIELTGIAFNANLGTTKDALPQAVSSLERFVNTYPNNILSRGQLASLYRMTKQYDKAEHMLRTIPSSSWNYVIETEMGRIMAAQGRCAEAEAWFLAAIRERSEQNISRTTFDLAILYAVCQKDMEKAKHYFKRYTSYPIPADERERATQLIKKYVIDIDTSL